MNYRLLAFVKKNFTAPGTALDLGSGEGFDVACLKNIGWDVQGVDLKTGTDLNLPFTSKKVDLIYSNYLLQFLNNKKEFVNSCFNNLKKDGLIFIHTFDKSDRVLKNTLTVREVRKIFEPKFDNLKIDVFSEFDNHPKHRHWHKILEISGKKKDL
jgi:SAM-dependent methyltransferase